MNITAINTLAELLENIPPETKQGFNMISYFREVDERYASDDDRTNVNHQCGTVACVAGWAAIYLKNDGQGVLKRPRAHTSIGNTIRTANEIMGLDQLQSRKLFEPMNNGPHKDIIKDWSKVTPGQAAKVLRHLASTGEVDWEVAFA